MAGKSGQMTPEQREELFGILRDRFLSNAKRHQGMAWCDVEVQLKKRADKLWSLYEMERTGGAPDVVAFDADTGEHVFFDCAAESPLGRRSVCYDGEAREKRKENKPQSSALEMAAELGAQILTEAEYRYLQTLGSFDTKTSSWVLTPLEIRKLGGALFGDRRYNTVFTYHNGADSYYASRGFRCVLRV